MARIKSANSIAAPQDEAEAELVMERIQKINIWIRDIDTSLREDSAKLKRKAEDAAAPHKAEKKELETGLFAWAEANRMALTKGGRTKTVKMGAGIIRWRQLPPKVSLKGVDAIIEHLKASGLGRFIRKKETVDKEALLKEPAVAGEVPGVKIGSEGEMIEFLPHEEKLEGEAA